MVCYCWCTLKQFHKLVDQCDANCGSCPLSGSDDKLTTTLMHPNNGIIYDEHIWHVTAIGLSESWKSALEPQFNQV